MPIILYSLPKYPLHTPRLRLVTPNTTVCVCVCVGRPAPISPWLCAHTSITHHIPCEFSRFLVLRLCATRASSNLNASASVHYISSNQSLHWSHIRLCYPTVNHRRNRILGAFLKNLATDLFPSDPVVDPWSLRRKLNRQNGRHRAILIDRYLWKREGNRGVRVESCSERRAVEEGEEEKNRKEEANRRPFTCFSPHTVHTVSPIWVCLDAAAAWNICWYS